MEINKVLICDAVSPRCAEIMSAAGIQVDTKEKLKPEALAALIGEYDAMVVRSATTVSADILKAGTKLKLVGRAGTGYDNIDTDEATRRGVIVMNTPGGNTISAAEHTCALLMAMARHIPQAHMSLKNGKWDRKTFMGNELQGKTLAILGLGRIGREVSSRMKAFGMRTIGYDPILPVEVAASFGVESLPLEQIWPQADFITVHTPLTESTRNLLCTDVFAQCKPSVRVVNCARGGIISEADLLKALEEGKVGGAAIDVFEEEPPKNEVTLKLIAHPNMISTPHLGASTEEAQLKVAEEIAEQIVKCKTGEAILGVVNAPALVHAMKEGMQPWVALATRLGMLASQLMGSSVFGKNTSQHALKQLQVKVQGKAIQQSSATLVNACIVGLLNHLNSTMINLVNAPVVAEQFGINVVEVRSQSVHAEYQQCISIAYEADNGNTYEYVGTVFGEGLRGLRLVKVEGYGFEVAPVGNMIFYSNEDKPGVLAAISAALCKAGVNIGDFNMSRQPNGLALTILNTDDAISDELVESLKKIDFVVAARKVIMPKELKTGL